VRSWWYLIDPIETQDLEKKNFWVRLTIKADPHASLTLRHHQRQNISSSSCGVMSARGNSNDKQEDARPLAIARRIRRDRAGLLRSEKELEASLDVLARETSAQWKALGDEILKRDEWDELMRMHRRCLSPVEFEAKLDALLGASHPSGLVGLGLLRDAESMPPDQRETRSMIELEDGLEECARLVRCAGSPMAVEMERAEPSAFLPWHDNDGEGGRGPHAQSRYVSISAVAWALTREGRAFLGSEGNAWTGPSRALTGPPPMLRCPLVHVGYLHSSARAAGILLAVLCRLGLPSLGHPENVLYRAGRDGQAELLKLEGERAVSAFEACEARRLNRILAARVFRSLRPRGNDEDGDEFSPIPWRDILSNAKGDASAEAAARRLARQDLANFLELRYSWIPRLADCARAACHYLFQPALACARLDRFDFGFADSGLRDGISEAVSSLAVASRNRGKLPMTGSPPETCLRRALRMVSTAGRDAEKIVFALLAFREISCLLQQDRTGCAPVLLRRGAPVVDAPHETPRMLDGIGRDDSSSSTTLEAPVTLRETRDPWSRQCRSLDVYATCLERAVAAAKRAREPDQFHLMRALPEAVVLARTTTSAGGEARFDEPFCMRRPLRKGEFDSLPDKVSAPRIFKLSYRACDKLGGDAPGLLDWLQDQFLSQLEAGDDISSKDVLRVLLAYNNACFVPPHPRIRFSGSGFKALLKRFRERTKLGLRASWRPVRDGDMEGWLSREGGGSASEVAARVLRSDLLRGSEALKRTAGKVSDGTGPPAKKPKKKQQRRRREPSPSSDVEEDEEVESDSTESV
jgi:hypothetical protein